MSLFGGFKGGFTGGIVSTIPDLRKEPTKKQPNIIDKIDMIFTDVETEGKKQGYERAAKEYEIVFEELENTYKEVKRIISLQQNELDNRSDKLIEKLSQLEKEKEYLMSKVNNKSNKVSKVYNIPLSQVRSCMNSGSLLTSTTGVGILDMIYNYKEKKLKAAEKRGYLEAKELYEEKLRKMRNELVILKQKSNRKIQEMTDLIFEVLDEITKTQIQIAELSILL